jgi:hypothetical protein
MSDELGDIVSRDVHHVAVFDAHFGSVKLKSRLSVSTGGLLAISALVGVILAGTAGIVWVATAPARQRAAKGH